VPRLAYNLEEAAEALGVSRDTLRREINDGKLSPSACIRGRKVYTHRDLVRYLNDNRIPLERLVA
jgi:excisionase family DNA binding protein